MNDRERLDHFIPFVELTQSQFKKLVGELGLVSVSTLGRLFGNRADGNANSKKSALTKIARLIDPDRLQQASPTDPVATARVGARLRTRARVAFQMWEAFLAGDTDTPPTWDAIEERWLVTCARIPELARTDNREHELLHLHDLVSELELVGGRHGIIQGARTPDDIVRWTWSSGKLDPAIWLRMRAAYYKAQYEIEHTADAIYFGTPILPLSIVPEDIWRLQVAGDGDQYRELLHAYGARWQRLRTAVEHTQQRVFAMFSEERTREFFATLQPEQRDACVRHISKLPSTNLTLLMTTSLTLEEEKMLCISLTKGGANPGLATADQLTTSKNPERRALVTRYGTEEYKLRDQLFNDVWNTRSRTHRILPMDLLSLVPASKKARPSRKS